MKKDEFEFYVEHLKALLSWLRKKEPNGGIQEEIDIAEEFINRLIGERSYLVEVRLNIGDINKLFPCNVEELTQRGTELFKEEMTEDNKLKIGKWGTDILTALEVMQLKEQMWANQKYARLVVDYDE